MPAFIDIEVGTRICGTSRSYYKVVQDLGSGGNSRVYLVQSITGSHRGLMFALKVFVKIQDTTRRGRFSRETQFLKECNHPAVMRIYDDGFHPVSNGATVEEYPFVVVDYLPQTLREAMRGGLSMAEKVSFVLQLVSALAFLSTRNPPVIHRDIKPENIFVRGRSCILGDFGLMKLRGGSDEDDKTFFIDSAGPRLPRLYRSPDLVNYSAGTGELTEASDIYQLGLVVAEMFSGRVPLREPKELLDPIEPIPISPFGGAQAAAIVSEIKGMLELDPARRPTADILYDKWEGIFFEVVKISHQLEGRVFQ